MELPTVLNQLGYTQSENFVRPGTVAFARAQDIGHILRVAGRRCRLRGVYTLRPFNDETASRIPVVYVCQADDIATADKIHELVWNQDIVPFLLVHTPAGMRLYSGFQRSDATGAEPSGLLAPLIKFNRLHEELAEFYASAIDSGEFWSKRGADVRPDKRVYWSLLENLKQLAKKFRDEFGRENVKNIIHPLIGKYVYLHYLKDREFLSPRRMEEWKIQPATVFGHNATLAGLRTICGKLDEFLNGRVFPLKFRGKDAPTEEQIQRIAGAFAGDTFGGGWQFHLPFTAFKFAFIPIETLSMIYEQFLHLPEKADADSDEDEHSEGRKAGAYYTPISVVNYMLAELDKRRRLQRGVRVFDPSCGSGAFLVQCYRRLIEREFIHKNKKPTPSELATLLKRHIFGVDMDADACSVAEFSLYLTLLDYIEPADLIEHPRFKLPTLREQNIFETDFFKFKAFKTKFHWIAGNPPWKKLNPNKLELRDRLAMDWIKKNAELMPVGDNSLLQAFAWRCREFVAVNGECGLLIHAMTVFEDLSSIFRQRFFAEHRTHAVTNFSNLARDLFAGRAIAPAIALFFTPRRKHEVPDDLEMTTVFSPLLANQETTRPLVAGRRNETWSISVNGDEIREIPYCEIASGGGLSWKLATWGSNLDAALLSRMRRKWGRLEDIEAIWKQKDRTFIQNGVGGILAVAQGPDLGNSGNKGYKFVEELTEKRTVDVDMLKRLRNVHSFNGFDFPTNSKHYLRERGGWKGLPVCRPPHVIVSAARNYAVFSNEFLIVESRQIGIVSVPENRPLLKALALYLSSDFAYYHQFLTTTELGVKRDRATLESLRQIPIPLSALSTEELARWEALHDRLAQTKPRILPDPRQPDAELGEATADDGQDSMVEEMNQLVSDALGLDEADRALVEDFVKIRLSLNDGKIGRAAMKAVSTAELQTYAEWLQRELAANTSDDSRFNVTILHDERSGFIAIEPAKGKTNARVIAADAATARTLAATRERLREDRGQWVYFDRSLRIHEGEKTYLFKPIQRMHWTRTRALLDAADITIGESPTE